MGEALTTSDLIIVDDGAGGTNRKNVIQESNLCSDSRWFHLLL